MFDKNFFPTPGHLIRKMLEPHIVEYAGRERLNLTGKQILEPSAGKGDIVEFIEKFNYSQNTTIHCIEKSSELSAVLRDKDFDVIHDDFLTFKTNFKYDFIVMNPPFNKGCQHLLHAWNIMKEGEIICLLNAETVKNTFSQDRKELKRIIDDFGTTEFIDYAFTSAERKSNVKTVIVRLTKVNDQDEYNFDFDRMQKDKYDIPEDPKSQQLETIDILKNLERRYSASIQAYENLKKAQREFEMCTSIFPNNVYDDKHNVFISKLNMSGWNKVLDQTKFQTLLTSKVQSDFTNKFSQQKNIAFTKDNMLMFFQVLWDKKDDILNDCILEVFDKFTAHSEDNRVNIEGWKTNDAYKVNKKVIFSGVKYGSYCSVSSLKIYGDKFSLDWIFKKKLDDIERCLNLITGKKIENILTVSDAMEKKFKEIGQIKTGESFDSECSSTYFNIRFFKKGSIHLTWKDKQTLYMFNEIACKLRGFPLPEHTAKSDREYKKKTERQQNRRKTHNTESNTKPKSATIISRADFMASV